MPTFKIIPKPPEASEALASSKPLGPQRGPSGIAIAQEHARSLKLAIPKAPLAEDGGMLQLELPRKIADWSSDELGELYAQFSGLASYAEVHVATADVERSDAKAHHEKMKALQGLSTEGANATERNAAVAMHPDVVAASEEFRIADAKYTLLTSLFNGYDRSMRTISREFSRRGIDVK